MVSGGEGERSGGICVFVAVWAMTYDLIFE